jgi:hypothetical protein
MECFVCVFNEDGSLTGACADLQFPAVGASIQTTGTLAVPTNGSVNAECDLPGSSGINTINYTP